jgi:methanogenic corrinoid protein MtbC1
MSSLLTPSLPYIKDVVKRLESQGQRDRFMLIAGGAPITKAWADQSGLNGFGEDAVEAVTLCRTLMQRRAEG